MATAALGANAGKTGPQTEDATPRGEGGARLVTTGARRADAAAGGRAADRRRDPPRPEARGEVGEWGGAAPPLLSGPALRPFRQRPGAAGPGAQRQAGG